MYKSFILSLLLAVLICGCAAKPEMFRPDFDKSNAVMIERSVGALQLADAIKGYVNTGDKVALVSIELPYTVDHAINYLIEDNLIGNLIRSGYRVLERDAEMIPRLVSESDNNYRIVSLCQYGPAIKGEECDISLPDMEGIMTQMDSADKIISYRLLECGILYEIPEGAKLNQMGKPEEVNRLARTRLHIRVTDVKTGEIKLASILENEIRDTIPWKQVDSLSDVHYKYYDQALPNLRKPTNAPGSSQEHKMLGPESEAKKSSVGKTFVGLTLTTGLIGGGVLLLLYLLD